MARILYIENGRATDAAANLFGKKLQKSGICNLNKVNLILYDVIIIPSYSNQNVLAANFQRIERFLKHGGILVVLGAFQDKEPWLPYCNFVKPFLENVKFKNTDNSVFKQLLQNLSITEDAITYHGDFISHGSFICSSNDCLPIITGVDPTNLVLAIVEPHGLSGKILVSTLDPDHHAVIGYTRSRMDANHQAQTLFSNIISWAETEVEKKGSAAHVSRYVIGISRTIAIQSGVIASVCICVMAIMGYLLGALEKETFAVVASVASIVSLGLSIFQLPLQRP